MSQIRTFGYLFLFSIFFAAAMAACGKENPDANFDSASGRHRDGWSNPLSIGRDNFHAFSVKRIQSDSRGAVLFSSRCAICHDSDATGRIGTSILSETPALITSAISSVPLMRGQSDLSQADIQEISDYIAVLAAGGQPVSASFDTSSCISCHGADLDGGISRISCFSCHDGPGGNVGHPGEAWHDGTGDPVHFHGSYGSVFRDSCTTCHGVNFAGGIGPACSVCHDGTEAQALDFIQVQAQGNLVTLLTNLTGAQEVPPVQTTGSGAGALNVDLVTRAISGSVSFSGLTSNATFAHIHLAPAGINGPVQVGLIDGAGVTQGVWLVPAGTILTQVQFDALISNQLYFNVHTVNNPAGEIRGQLIYGSGFTTSVPLSGTQEVPPVATAGSGTGNLTVNLVTRAVSGSVSFSGLTSNAIAAHIHLGPAGVNGGIEIFLTGGAGVTQGVWLIPAGTVLTQAQFDALITNQLYFNIHTATNPGGEIRGQIVF
ncbi:MAG: CHRD domain-containing protein [Nitrospiraceae bacterium]|nr:MAG: CHRD domain-containing protein [Nitrospiraceae bacterium]